MVQDDEADTVFLSAKINKLRWHPAPLSVYPDSEQRGVLAVGTYDQLVNQVALYSLRIGNFPLEMTRLCFSNVKGGVADLRFSFSKSLHASQLFASTFNGDFLVYRTSHLDEMGQLFPEGQGQSVCPDLSLSSSTLALHQGALSSMDVSENGEVVTAGSDGDVKIVDVGEGTKVVRTLDGAGLAISCVRYINTNVIAAANHIKLFDLRSNTQQKIRTEKPTQSITTHPHQGNFFCTGTEDGTVCVWDLRSTNAPVSSQHIHNDNVWEVQFTPSNPDVVVSCASESLALVNYNAEHQLQQDFGSKARARRPNITVMRRESHGFNSCDAHEASGLVAFGGDSGAVVVSRLNVHTGGANYGFNNSKMLTM